LVQYFCDAFFALLRVLYVGLVALENEWYIVIKAHKFTVFEILRVFASAYIACLHYPYI